MSSLVTTFTLAGVSTTFCSVRVGVTVTVSNSVAGDSVISTSARPAEIDSRLLGESARAHDHGDLAGFRHLDREAAVGTRRHARLGTGAGAHDDRCARDRAARRVTDDARDRRQGQHQDESRNHRSPPPAGCGRPLSLRSGSVNAINVAVSPPPVAATMN